MSERMLLRSAVPAEQKKPYSKLETSKKEHQLNKPMLSYSGKVNYATSLIDCAVACDELLKMAEECLGETFVVGFDMEWPFSFQTGPGKTALIQISPNLDICYLLHLSTLKNLPRGLFEFLHHPKVKLTGVNIKNDVRKLTKDFTGFDTDKLLNSCIDSGVMANSVLPLTQRWSMEKLVNYVLKMNINKNKKVRMSKWHIVPLSPQQQMYAAIDGYASLLLYQELEKLKRELLKEQDMNNLNKYIETDNDLSHSV